MQTPNWNIDLNHTTFIGTPFFDLLKYSIVLKIQTNLSRINLQPSFKKTPIGWLRNFRIFWLAALHMSWGWLLVQCTICSTSHSQFWIVSILTNLNKTSWTISIYLLIKITHLLKVDSKYAHISGPFSINIHDEII